MMILAAVVLLIGFIALAGMVARVSQLGSQTTIESEQAILHEVGPLADSMDTAICRLKPSSLSKAQVADGVTTSGSTTLGSADADFVPEDIGMVVAGTGLAPGTRILAVAADGNSATMTVAASATGTGRILRFTPCLATGTLTTFDLDGATSPTLEAAVISVMEHLQSLMASRGLFMDWELGCFDMDGDDDVTDDPDDVDGGQVTAQLWDGTVWVQVKSSVVFPRADCSTVAG